MFDVNSFQVPNILVDELLPKLNGNDLKILLTIIRKTKGWNKEYDGISISQFQKFTGIKDERTIKKSIKKLIELKLIEKIDRAGTFSLFRLIPPAKNEGGQKMRGDTKNAPTPPAKNEGKPPAKNAPHNNTLPKYTNTKNNNKTLSEIINSFLKKLSTKTDINLLRQRSKYEKVIFSLSKYYSLKEIEEALNYALEEEKYLSTISNPSFLNNSFENIKLAKDKEKRESSKEMLCL